jgi:hypothetical protein
MLKLQTFPGAASYARLEVALKMRDAILVRIDSLAT